MKNSKDNIYIYLWEEFNTVYVGRTVNPKGRHYQHKHRESEKTYQFSSEHHVEHPNMIIIENDLSINEGIEREKYWINYYKNSTLYNVLNITIGGQIGGGLSTITEEEKKEKLKQYYKSHKKDRALYYKLRYREANRWKKILRIQNKINKKIFDAGKKIEKSIKKMSKEFYYNNKENFEIVDKKTYYEKNREERLKYAKKYYFLNKEKINKKSKEYKEKNKEHIKLVKKKYRETHKDKIKEYNIKYRNLHKNK